MQIQKIITYNSNNHITQISKQENHDKSNVQNGSVNTQTAPLGIYYMPVSFKANSGMELEPITLSAPYYGQKLKLPSPWLNSATKEIIKSSASKRITGEKPWPEIKDINSWMVTAETSTLMSIGGLAQVAVDLPDSFNNKFRHRKNHMTIVTPMYVDGKNLKLEKDGKELVYTAGNKKVKVKKITEIDVPMYDDWKLATRDLKVNVYKGVVDGGQTEYILLDNPEIFDINPSLNNDANASGCYVENQNGYNISVRFAFFSKAVYELLKSAHKTENKNLKPPNSVILNDWHTGAIAPLMRYMAPAEREFGKINDKTFSNIEQTPLLYIGHNFSHQANVWNNGSDDKSIERILITLFEKFAIDITGNAFSWKDLPSEDRNALFKYNDYNPTIAALNLVDRVIPVSENYSEELLSSIKLTSGIQNILKTRDYYSTLTPITNGYSKVNIEPTERNVSNLLQNASKDMSGIRFSDIDFRPYTNTTLKGKDHNKNEVMKILKRLIEREKSIQAKDINTLTEKEHHRRYILEDPFSLDISKIEDFSKVPVIVSVGRLAGQKGYHDTFKNAILELATNYPKGKEVPIMIIGGKIEESYCYEELKNLKEQLKSVNPEFSERFILIKGFANTHLFAMAADLFAIPSNFEPCGLIQMEAMAKGAIPVATSTGGLVTTIKDGIDGFRTKTFYDTNNLEDPFRYRVYQAPGETEFRTNPEAFKEALQRALDTYFDKPEEFRKMQKNAMENDFSWLKNNGPLDKYVSLIKTGRLKD